MIVKRMSLLALGLAFLVPAAAQEKPLDAAPKMVLAAPSHDFGQVKPGTPLTFSFKVKNEGRADLQILSVAPS